MNEGVVGKYVKKDTPPEIPVTNVWSLEKNRNRSKVQRGGVLGVSVAKLIKQKKTSTTFILCFVRQQQSLQTQQQLQLQQQQQQQQAQQYQHDVNTNAHIIQATNQKFGTNGKLNASGGLGHEGKYTPK